MKTLQNSKAVKLINKLIEDVSQNGIIINTVVEDLKALRPYTIQEELPLLAKATRLAAEHIEENETFAIPIPQDEPIEGEETELKKSYYLYGIEMTKDEWTETRQDREGLPWYKSATLRGTARM